MKRNVEMVPSILFGIGIIAKLEEVMIHHRSKNVLWIIDEAVVHKRIFDRYIDLIKRQKNSEMIVLKEEVLSLRIINKLIDRFRGKNFDLCVGIGQGNILSLTKVVALHLHNEHMPIQSITNSLPLNKNIPTLLIPTTTQTSQQPFLTLKSNYGDAQMLHFISHRYLLPNQLLYDPMLLMTVPPTIIAASCIKSLSKACEVYVTKNSSHWISSAALTSIKIINSSTIRATYDQTNRIAKQEIAKSGLFAGIAFSQIKRSLFHFLFSPLQSKYNLSNGVTCAILLPHFIEYYIDKMNEVKQNAFFQAMHIDETKFHEGKQEVVKKLQTLFSGLGFPTELSTFGITMSDIYGLADDAYKLSKYEGNIEKEKELFIEIYERAL